MTYELDLNNAMVMAEEMLCGISDNNFKLLDMSASIALIINTLAHEYEVDSMILIHDIETMVNKIEDL